MITFFSFSLNPTNRRLIKKNSVIHLFLANFGNTFFMICHIHFSFIWSMNFEGVFWQIKCKFQNFELLIQTKFRKIKFYFETFSIVDITCTYWISILQIAVEDAIWSFLFIKTIALLCFSCIQSIFFQNLVFQARDVTHWINRAL